MPSGFHFISSSTRQRALGSALLLCLAFGFLAVPSVLNAQEFTELPPELDARAADLYTGIMCPICNGQTISQSHAAISETMRKMVRERLVAGDTNQQIYDSMVEAFGRDILASPPKSGIALAVWIVPPIALVLGGFAVTLFIQRLRKTNMLATGVTYADRHNETDEELERYLQLVDGEMEESH